MKHFIIIIFLFIIKNAFALNKFYLYDLSKTQLDKLLIDSQTKTLSPVFSKNELASLEGNTSFRNAYKLLSSKSYTELKNDYKIEIEKLQHIQLKDYSQNQWYFDNKETTYQRWISDIEKEIILGNPKAQIHLPDNLNTKEVTIAIIDSGIDINHPQLRNSIKYNQKECLALEHYNSCIEKNSDQSLCENLVVDEDQNGYPLDCHGWSFTQENILKSNITGSPLINDKNGHGTHIAGIIAAKKTSSDHIKGINEAVKILPIQVAMSSNSQDPIENIAKGILYAIQNKARIINLSLGWRYQYDSKMVRELIEYAHKKDILVVAAAGNDAHADISFPCAYTDVVCVGSVNESGQLSRFSNHGPSVDVLAPGHNILSTYPTNKRSRFFTENPNYEYLSGTSQAAPMVSAALSILLGTGLTSEQARIQLLSSTLSYTTLTKSKKQIPVRNGLIHIENALNSKTTSLLYPINKEPYLVKYQENKNVELNIKYKFYGKNSPDTIKLQLDSENKNLLLLNSEITLNKVNINHYHGSIKAKILQNNFSEFYLSATSKNHNAKLRFKIIRVLTPQTEGHDIHTFHIDEDILENAIIKQFENNHDNKIDLIAIKKVDGLNSIQILKQEKDHYKVSRKITLREKNSTVLALYKIDYDFDHLPEFVISYVFTNKEKKKITKFLILTDKLTPKRDFIVPKNAINNETTFIPAKFNWIKVNNRLVPAWVGFGKSTVKINRSPWESFYDGETNQVYFLDPQKGLNNLVNSNHSEILLTFFNQSLEWSKSGKAFILSVEGKGFLKEYHIYEINNFQLNKVQSYNEIEFDLLGFRAIKNRTNNLIFNISDNKNTYILNFSPKKTTLDIKTIPHLSQQEPHLLHIGTIENIEVLQTRYKIHTYDYISGSSYSIASKTNAKRKKYFLLKNAKKLILPNNEAPGIIGDIYTFSSNGTLFKRPQEQIIGAKGCRSIGSFENTTKSSSIFICPKDKILKLIDLK